MRLTRRNASGSVTTAAVSLAANRIRRHPKFWVLHAGAQLHHRTPLPTYRHLG